MLEQEEALRNGARFRQAIDRELDHLQTLCVDWAAWDNTYDFVISRDQRYVSTNLTEETFTAANLDLLGIYNVDGQRVWATGASNDYEVPGTSFTTDPQEDLQPLIDGEIFVKPEKSGQPISGVLSIGGVLHLIAAEPILDSNHGGPSRGVVIMGRVLDESLYEQLEDQVQANIAFWRTVDPAMPDDAVEAYTKMQETPMLGLVQRTNDETLHVHGILYDMRGKEAAVFQVEMDRPIWEKGKTSARYALLYVIATGVLLLCVLGRVVAREVILPITQITQSVERQRNNDVIQPIALKRDDELGRLSCQLDRMVKELHAANAKLHEEARHDGLTGLPNRTEIYRQLEACLERSYSIKNYKMALFFLDLDKFKRINDTLGHKIGDGLLVEVAERLRETVRSTDNVACSNTAAARIGGDEFVVVLDNLSDYKDAEHVAHRVSLALSKPFNIQGHTVRCGVSIGIAFNQVEYAEPDEMIRDADAAMYLAKAKPDDPAIVVFNESMADEQDRRGKLAEDLKQAFDNEELEFCLQPIISADTCRAVSFEAVAVWHRSARERICGADLMDIAELNEMVVPLGLWLLNNACDVILEWEQKFGESSPTISVDVFAAQLHSVESIQGLVATIDEAKVNRELLRLEIKEQFFEGAFSEHVQALEDICSVGIQLHIDDFGHGYSSLSSLCRIPFRMLKVDRKFIDELHSNREYAAVVQAVVSLARHFKLEVVADGVESMAQLTQVIALDCDYVQGELFAAPAPPSEAEEHVNQLFTVRTIKNAA